LLTGKGDCHHLRSWTLSGTNEDDAALRNDTNLPGATVSDDCWTTLDERRGDSKLAGAGDVGDWEVSNYNNQSESFRYLRLHQTGKNSTGEDFLRFSSAEFYGDLLVDVASASAASSALVSASATSTFAASTEQPADSTEQNRWMKQNHAAVRTVF
jgi:hypothetical protein